MILIMEGDEMIAELERELQKDDLTKQDIEGAEDKASTALAKSWNNSCNWRNNWSCCKSVYLQKYQHHFHH